MSEATRVRLVGDGPAAEAVAAAVGDDGREVEFADADGDALAEAVDTNDLPVVVAPAGDGSFSRVNALAPRVWLAVELGGVGGVAVDGVDAAATVLGGDAGCYDCLQLRVSSNLDGESTSSLDGEPASSRGAGPASPLDARPAAAPTVAPADARLVGAHAGRLAVDVLGGADVRGTVVELPHAERELHPVPGCACEGARSRALVRTHEDVPLGTVVQRADRAVDARLGLVRSIGEAESFPAPYYLATVCDTTGFSDARAGRQAAGVAADWNPAYVKAVGEALERYGAGVYRESATIEAAADDLETAVAVDRFVRPESGVEPFDPATPIRWIPGENLHTGDPVHLPAEFVLFPPPEERFAPAITTGLGLGSSGAGALVSGLTEVLERDATMLAWYSTFEPLPVAVDDPGFEQLARRARAEDLAVTPLLVTQDVDVPVVTVAVHRDGDWPRFAVGSGAGLDPEAAATGALEEALQNWMELRGMGPDAATEESTAIGRYAEFSPDARSLVDVEGRVPASSVGPEVQPTGVDVLPALLERVAAAGLEAYAARLTPRDVESLGFEVARVVVPGAQPLFVGERFFGERARTVPRELGFRPRLDRPPHPYP